VEGTCESLESSLTILLSEVPPPDGQRREWLPMGSLQVARKNREQKANTKKNKAIQEGESELQEWEEQGAT